MDEIRLFLSKKYGTRQADLVDWNKCQRVLEGKIVLVPDVKSIYDQTYIQFFISKTTQGTEEEIATLTMAISRIIASAGLYVQ